MRKFAVLLGGFGLAGAAYNSLSAAAPSADAAQKVVDARVAHYKDIGKSTKAIHDQLGQSQPDLQAIQSNARVIEALAKQIPTWFPKGTGQQPGVKTEALPAIWEQGPTFKQRAVDLAGAAHQLAAAAATGDPASTKAAFGKLGGACKACHDTFREKR
jgi:cytochrome c556